MKNKLILVTSACSLLLFFACTKEYSHPPLKQVNDGARLSIKSMKERLHTPFSHYRFAGGDTNLYCTVICDERSGNFYQQVFVKDETGAIQLNLKEPGGLYTGDQVRINLNDLYLVLANNMIYLDSVNVSRQVVKLSSGNKVLPKQATLNEILLNMADPTASSNLQSQLVRIDEVEFISNPLISTFADAVGKTSVNHTITSCEAGKVLTVRTSGRSSFAGKTLPKGNGSITGILTQYNSSMSLMLRDHNEATMSGPRCAAPTVTLAPGVILLKDFNDNSISSGGWTSYVVNNTSVNWYTGTSSLVPTPYARISGFIGGSSEAENWLISPAVDLTNIKEPMLSFRSAAKFSGTPLEVLVSGNYTSGDPLLASWSSLAPNYLLSPSAGDYLWTSSGSIPLAAHRSAMLRVAFKYKSTSAGATSYQLDDVLVKEK